MMDAVTRTTELNRVLWSCAQLAVDTHSVMTMRVMGMTGTWSVPDNEHSEMVQEKVPAFTEAAVAAVLTALAGRGPVRVLSAVIAPISEKASANRARLTSHRAREADVSGPDPIQT